MARDLWTTAGTLHLHTEAEVARPIVVVASERIDDDPGWAQVGIGELVHIGPDLSLTRELVITEEPARPMDLLGQAARVPHADATSQPLGQRSPSTYWRRSWHSPGP